jgi:hypothetical protein
VWVSVFAEQHSLHLLSTFVSHSFIHSLKGEFLSSWNTEFNVCAQALSLFLSWGQQQICRWVLIIVQLDKRQPSQPELSSRNFDLLV